MRDEFFNESLFLDLNQVRQILPAWVLQHSEAAYAGGLC